MKKFISNISTSTASAVNSAVKQIDKTLDKALVQPEQQVNTGQPAAENKNYVRLPLDSAKKLRWYDKSDVASLTRQHVREKHMLLDTIAALKKVMIRAGFTDAALDQEARELVAASERMRAADYGTEAVLLLAVQAEVESLTATNKSLRATNEQLQDQVQQLQDRLQDLQSSQQQATQPITAVAAVASSEAMPRTADSQQQPVISVLPPLQTDQAAASLSAVESGDVHQPVAAVANGLAQPPSLVEVLSASCAALKVAMAAAAMTAAEVRVHEGLLLEAEQQQQQQLVAAAAQQPANSTQQQQQPDTQQRERSTQQQQQQQHSSNQQKSDAACQTSDRVSADRMQRYQDLVQQLEDRCRCSERSASLSAARVSALEDLSAAAQQAAAAAQHRAQQATAAAKQQVAQLEERLRAAKASASHTPSNAAQSTLEQQQQQQQLAQVQDQLAASKAQVLALERRLVGAESREAQLMGQLRTAAAAAAERDEALAAAAALQQQLAKIGRDMSQLEHHKQRAASLEVAKSALEDQLSHLAAQVAALEERLRDVTAGREAATAAAELAAATAAKAQAAVAQQVASQVAACGHDRSLWPPAARQELQSLHQQVDTLQEQTQHSQAQLQMARQQLEDAQQSQADTQQALDQEQVEFMQVQLAAEQHINQLKSELQASQSEAAALTEALQQAQQQLKSLQEKAATPRHSGLDLRSVKHGTIGLVHSTSGSTFLSPKVSVVAGTSSQPKWQEQNQVGGGSLYGVADPAASTTGSSIQCVTAVDAVYLKNVVLKFLDAVLAGKTAERDALLPAIAAVLQVTPVEYAAMRKVLAATAPPATQVLSMFGKLANLTT